MLYAKLGKAGVNVSKVALGTLNFGPEISESESFQLLNFAVENGINFIDTANSYGWESGYGTSETIIGNWLQENLKRRDQIFLASKVCMQVGSNVNEKGLSAYHIKKACEDSLRRLKTDHIDLYQMHHIDRTVPFEEIWQAMELLIKEGKILYVGSSNFAGWHIAKAQECALKKNLLGLVSEQSIYNLTHREIEAEVIPACQDYGLAVLAWSPYNRGILCGVKATNVKSNKNIERINKEQNLFQNKLEKYFELCQKYNVSGAHTALSWLYSKPQLTTAVVGPRNISELEQVIFTLNNPITPEYLQELETLFPGVGIAPEAYAW